MISCRLVIIKCCKTQWVPVIWNNDYSISKQYTDAKRCHEMQCSMRHFSSETQPNKRIEEKSESRVRERRPKGRGVNEWRTWNIVSLLIRIDLLVSGDVVRELEQRTLIIYQIDDVPASANTNLDIINEFNHSTSWPPIRLFTYKNRSHQSFEFQRSRCRVPVPSVQFQGIIQMSPVTSCHTNSQFFRSENGESFLVAYILCIQHSVTTTCAYRWPGWI